MIDDALWLASPPRLVGKLEGVAGGQHLWDRDRVKYDQSRPGTRLVGWLSGATEGTGKVFIETESLQKWVLFVFIFPPGNFASVPVDEPVRV